MADQDIVEELREIQRMNTTLHGAKMAARAADEIERLRGMLEVQDEMVKHYVAERDEARLEICDRVSTTRWQPQFPLMTKRQYAEERGWDCFRKKP